MIVVHSEREKWWWDNQYNYVRHPSIGDRLVGVIYKREAASPNPEILFSQTEWHHRATTYNNNKITSAQEPRLPQTWKIECASGATYFFKYFISLFFFFFVFTLSLFLRRVIRCIGSHLRFGRLFTWRWYIIK